jgi:hypothetical protein
MLDEVLVLGFPHVALSSFTLFSVDILNPNRAEYTPSTTFTMFQISNNSTEHREHLPDILHPTSSKYHRAEFYVAKNHLTRNADINKFFRHGLRKSHVLVYMIETSQL